MKRERERVCDSTIPRKMSIILFWKWNNSKLQKSHWFVFFRSFTPDVKQVLMEEWTFQTALIFQSLRASMENGTFWISKLLFCTWKNMWLTFCETKVQIPLFPTHITVASGYMISLQELYNMTIDFRIWSVISFSWNLKF